MDQEVVPESILTHRERELVAIALEQSHIIGLLLGFVLMEDEMREQLASRNRLTSQVLNEIVKVGG